jgi:hypothetical protein
MWHTNGILRRNEPLVNKKVLDPLFTSYECLAWPFAQLAHRKVDILPDLRNE